MIVRLIASSRLSRLVFAVLLGRVAKKILDIAFNHTMFNYYTCCDCKKVIFLKAIPPPHNCLNCGSVWSIFSSTNLEIQKFNTRYYELRNGKR